MASKKLPQVPEDTNPLNRFSGTGKPSKKDLPSKEELSSKEDLSSNEQLESKEDFGIPSVRVNYAFKINEYLLEKLRDIAYWERVTMADLLDEAVGKIIEQYEKSNKGPYEKRTNKLKTGRPVK